MSQWKTLMASVTCTESDHQKLKVSREAFEAGTLVIGEQHLCGGVMLMGNCHRCQSTLGFELVPMSDEISA